MNSYHPQDAELQCYENILSTASFFEEEFNIDWIIDLCGKKASEIFAALEYGIQKEWLANKNKGTFYFTDFGKRKELSEKYSPGEQNHLHQRIADLLVRELDEEAAKNTLIAPHLLFVSNDLDGCKLLIESGKQFEKDFRYDDARKSYEKAVEDLKKLKGNERDRLFIESALKYSRVCMDEIGVDRTISVLHDAVTLANGKKIFDYMPLLELHVAKNEWMRSRFQVARRHYKRGCLLSDQSQNPKLLSSVSVFHIFFHYWMGRYRDAVQAYEAFAPAVENFPTYSMPLLASITAGACYGFCGQTSQSLGMLHAIRSHSLKIENLYAAGHAGTTIGEMLVCNQYFEESLRHLEESMKETQAAHNIFAYLGTLVLLGYALYKLHDYKKALFYLREYLRVSQNAQINMRYGLALIELTWAIKNGILPAHKGLKLETGLQSVFQGEENIFMKGIACRFNALLKRGNGAPSREIIAELRRSIKYLEASGHQMQFAESKVELMREYLRLGDERQARKAAEPAIKIISSMNDSAVPDDARSLVTNPAKGENLLQEIMSLGQELVTIRESRDLFRRIISIVIRITSAERGAIFLVGEKTGDVILRGAKNLTTEDIGMPQFGKSMQFIKETIKTGKGRIMEWGDKDPSISFDGSGIRSCVCVPMKMRGKTIGVLYHDNRIFRSMFRESDLEILNYFAAQAAIAMDNAQAWQALQEMYDKKQSEKEYYEMQYLENIHFENFVGRSSGIVQVFGQIEHVAGTDSTVLILGETGVGKELVARSIHRRSARGEKPFICVNCSALPESLSSSELFGHEKGAFTGAISRHLGRFELAHGGTLFLDEIGDISLEIQAKLLRVLQSGEFDRVGGNETLHSDFRLIAATNRDLWKDVQTGRFREDLYYRLSVFPIKVPPLRERQEDVPLLVQYFLEKFASKFGTTFGKISKEDVKKLTAYHWPGNVRELQNVIERAVIVSKGARFRLPELEPEKRKTTDETSILTLQENEKSHILKVLYKTRGKIYGPGGAAEILAVPTSTLNSRMKKLGIRNTKQYHTE